MKPLTAGRYCLFTLGSLLQPVFVIALSALLYTLAKGAGTGKGLGVICLIAWMGLLHQHVVIVAFWARARRLKANPVGFARCRNRIRYAFIPFSASIIYGLVLTVGFIAYYELMTGRQLASTEGTLTIWITFLAAMACIGAGITSVVYVYFWTAIVTGLYLCFIHTIGLAPALTALFTLLGYLVSILRPGTLAERTDSQAMKKLP